MSERKYGKYVITEDVRSSQPPPAAFLKRLKDQRKTGNYTDSDHVLRLNDAVAEGALYFDAVWFCLHLVVDNSYTYLNKVIWRLLNGASL